MRNPFLFLFGLAMILLGVVFMVDNALGFDLLRLLWPIGLILAGIALIAQRNRKPAVFSSSLVVSKQNNAFISEVNRNGHWLVENESFSAFISDLSLDLRDADIPKGETVYQISGFIGDVSLTVPNGVAVMVSSSAFISDINMMGSSETGFFGPVTLRSDDYELAGKKIRVEASHFIGDITVKASAYSSAQVIEEKSPKLLT